MTNIMEYGAAGLIGCLLFWTIGGAKIETAFSGFVNDTPWFLFGAILLGARRTRPGCRNASGLLSSPMSARPIRGCCLASSSRASSLTLIVPSGAARLVVMASIALGVVNAFGAGKGSNIGAGFFSSSPIPRPFSTRW